VVSTDQNSSTGVLGTLGITGPPTAGGGTTKSTSPLGVPSGYQPPTYPGPNIIPVPGQTPFDAGPTTTTVYGSGVNPTLYTETDKWGPAANPTQVPTIQAELIAAGLLNAKDVRVGVWDAASADAYGKVLSFANTQGMTAVDALTLLTENPPIGKTSGGSGSSGGTQPIISFTNPADVQTEFQNVSQNLTGQEQNPAAFVQQYHADEAAAGHQRGQNYTQAPSLTGAATQYVQNNMPGQEAAYGTASRMQQFFSMVGQ